VNARLAADRWSSERAPNPLHDEVVRQRLIDRLASRWNVPVIVMEAAGGYGKSIALAQAMRDNEFDPTGVDVYLACRRPDADAHHFARRVLARLEGPVGAVDTTDDLADLIVTHLALRSPSRVALILDDLHHLRPDDSTTALLVRLVRNLPTNGRLVLSGREIPTLPLARLVASDGLVRIDASDLAFTADEVAELAGVHRVDARQLASAAGWPALTRLAITVGSVASMEYLMEEVVEALDDRERRAIAVTVIAKRVDTATIRRISKVDSVRSLLAHVPLLHVHDDGWLSAHDLWSEALPDVATAEELSELAGEVAKWHLEHQRFVDAVELATAHGAWAEGLDGVVGYIAGGDAFPSAVRVASWLDRFPPTLQSEPALVLLRGMAARIAEEPGAGQVDVERALEMFLERGNVAHISAAGFEVGYGAWLRGDLARVLDMYRLAVRLRDEGHQHLVPMIEIVSAVLADLEGDPLRARAHLEAVDLRSIPTELATYVLREHMALSQRLGESSQAVDTAESIREWSRNAGIEFLIVMAHWQHGDPGPALQRWPELRHSRVDHSHDDFFASVYCTLVDASLGLSMNRSGLSRFPAGRTREVALRAIATAASLVADGNIVDAAMTIEKLVDDVGLDDALCIGELRRLLPLGYVLSERVRSNLDASELGPKHREWRCTARALLDARAGLPVDFATLPSPSQILCALPLRWSTELAALGAHVGSPQSLQLASYLIDVTDGRAETLFDEMREQAGPLGSGARAVLDMVPRAPGVVVRVLGCGPMSVSAGQSVDPAILRRSRVRELLGLLLLRDRLSIDQVTESVWPGLGASQAKSNLRITLMFLRRLLEPQRPVGGQSFHVCRDASHIWLRRSGALRSDVWDIQSNLTVARERKRTGDVGASVDALRCAVDAWSGELLGDLRYNDLAVPEVTHLELALSDGAAQIAEWSLAHGEVSDAIVVARRLLAHDPYHERAYAVLISAHMDAGSMDESLDAASQCRSALDELRVAPSNATLMVLKRLDRAVADHRSLSDAV
jgi:LuxR family transcriptional regulator, maltose regulon positive regulatory protein